MGAWIETLLVPILLRLVLVAPYVGAWIETLYNYRNTQRGRSHPTWVRGLKQCAARLYLQHHKVAPYVGAWIETARQSEPLSVRQVAPYVGAWIETLYELMYCL